MSAHNIISRPFRERSTGCLGLCNSDFDNDGKVSSNYPRYGNDHDITSLTPEVKQQKQELDDLLSQAMNELSFTERQEQQEIVHGVQKPDVEDDAFMDHALRDLEQFLSQMKQGTSYELAEQIDHSYVHARPFRVMFLRANEYDPQASADQMIRFFDLKRELFCDEKLAKDITIEDLNEEDIAFLRTGSIQMGGRDRSGRQVMIRLGYNLGNTPFKSVQTDLRVAYFMYMKALKSDQTQIRGIVSIWYTLGELGSFSNGNGYIENFKASRAIPLKKAAIHLCLDDLNQFLFCKGLISMMNNSMRARFNFHFGSPIECQYRLSTFGILPSSLPLHDNGKMDFNRHLQWVDDCIKSERDTLDPLHRLPLPGPLKILVASDTTQEVCPEDVLFTGAKNANKHEGNQRYRAFIVEFEEAYNNGNDETKRKIVSIIISRVCEAGGRFLKKGRNSEMVVWVEIPQDELRKKVMQGFRNRRRTRQKSYKTRS